MNATSAAAMLSMTCGLLAQGPTDLPELVATKIPGAPALSAPQLVMGATGPVVTDKHGLASPAMHDHDGDGLDDLWIGEFETGPCHLRVYRNIGSRTAPRFADEFRYALDYDDERLKIDSW